jgi:tetratricopeptide (TPR) repeat protein
VLTLLSAGLAALAALRAQGPVAPAPAPPSAHVSGPEAIRVGRDEFDRNDPVGALLHFRRAQRVAPDLTEVWAWLGRCHLELGEAGLALRCVRAARGALPAPELAALEVRALLRAREFDAALANAEAALSEVDAARHAELLAAYASSLFRMQRNDEAAESYARVVQLDPWHVEGHIRLGSGLTPPREFVIGEELRLGVRQARAGDHRAAIGSFAAALQRTPGHPVAHRLLAESLLAQRYENSMPALAPEFARLRRALPQPELDEAVLAQFIGGYRALGKVRQAACQRALALFQRRLPKLVVMGGSHDLLDELERTTDAAARASLRGRRTFDGRVWDDVRGMGGLRAATGIESLDDADQFGFDTLAHEVAHQVHLYTFTPVQRRKVRDLYHGARTRAQFLDFYAASNEAEYFGQGVEAFASLAKRPGREVTHGHTRFELLRVDPELYAFIAELVDFDPLREPAGRAALLPAAAEVALRCGRWADALVAVELMDEGPVKIEWRERAARALRRGMPW